MTEPVLRFERVTRRFGAKLALDGTDLRLEAGQVLGLVGRNGAGKTTALRLAHGLLHADEGRITVVGRDPVTQGLAIRERVSLLSEETALYPWMTVREILEFACALHPRWDPSLAEQLRRRLDVAPDEPIRTLSRGTKAKVALIVAVAGRPQLLLLDDPTAGLDPLSRREVLEGILDAVVEEGGAVLYASHLVHDVERIADEVVVLDRGRVVLSGALDDLKATLRRATAVFPSSAPVAVRIPETLEVRADGRVLTVLARARNGELEAALRQLGAQSVEVVPLNLEEILVALLRAGTPAEETRDGGR